MYLFGTANSYFPFCGVSNSDATHPYWLLIPQSETCCESVIISRNNPIYLLHLVLNFQSLLRFAFVAYCRWQAFRFPTFIDLPALIPIDIPFIPSAALPTNTLSVSNCMMLLFVRLFSVFEIPARKKERKKPQLHPCACMPGMSNDTQAESCSSLPALTGPFARFDGDLISAAASPQCVV